MGLETIDHEGQNNRKSCKAKYISLLIQICQKRLKL